MYFTESRTDLPREAIGMYLLMGFVPEFLRKHIVTCEFLGKGVRTPVSPLDAPMETSLEQLSRASVYSFLFTGSYLDCTPNIHVPLKKDQNRIITE